MFLRTTTSVIAVVALSAPALADVTPSEVWQNWVAYYKANGYTVTEGAREEAGETLTLRDVVIAYDIPEGETRVELRTPEITLTGTGDGRVRTTMAETSPAMAKFRNEEGDLITLNGSLVARDTEIVSGGTPDEMTHESRAGELTLALASVQSADGVQNVPVTFKLLNATSRQQIVDSDMLRFDVTMAADRAELAIDYADPEGTEDPARIKVAAALDGVQGATTGAMPKDVNVGEDLAAALRKGMGVTGTLSAGQGTMDLDFAGVDEEGQEDTARAKSTMEGFELSIALGPEGLKYQGAADASSTELAISNVPELITYAVEQATFDVQMPVLKSDQPAPFKFAYSIGGLTIGDALWDLFPIAGTLPRDPASLDVDITGLLRMTMDLFDPALMAAAETEAEAQTDQSASDPAAPSAPAPDAGTGEAGGAADGGQATDGGEAMDEAMPSPFEPVQVTINKLALAALGASVDASGELMVPEGGTADQPVGKISARLEGINGLIDGLVKVGVISEEEVAGYRMMLAMFARPAPEGGDTLVSEFEFREDGQIFANGQQVK